jgi:replication initiation protein RepC
MPPRSAGLGVLEPLADALRALRFAVDQCLEESTKTSGSESQDERHHQSSKPETPSDSEPGFQRSWGEAEVRDAQAGNSPQRAYPLRMVVEACPDVVMYARHGIATWRDLFATAAVVRPVLGISPSAWEAAVAAMGEEEAAVALAAILQRAPMIKSPGGYLRNLTEKAAEGRFSAWPMLMALWRVSQGLSRRE